MHLPVTTTTAILAITSSPIALTSVQDHDLLPRMTDAPASTAVSHSLHHHRHHKHKKTTTSLLDNEAVTTASSNTTILPTERALDGLYVRATLTSVHLRPTEPAIHVRAPDQPPILDADVVGDGSNVGGSPTSADATVSWVTETPVKGEGQGIGKDRD